jgi:hypothetical protein
MVAHRRAEAAGRALALRAEEGVARGRHRVRAYEAPGVLERRLVEPKDLSARMM